MPAIHLIKRNTAEPRLVKVADDPLTYTSGYWSLTEARAKSLVGGRIYLHERQQEPSYFGGTITDAQPIRGGEHAGRVEFTFQPDAAGKNFRTPAEGWSQESKITREG